MSLLAVRPPLLGRCRVGASRAPATQKDYKYLSETSKRYQKR